MPGLLKLAGRVVLGRRRRHLAGDAGRPSDEALHNRWALRLAVSTVPMTKTCHNKFPALPFPLVALEAPMAANHLHEQQVEVLSSKHITRPRLRLVKLSKALLNIYTAKAPLHVLEYTRRCSHVDPRVRVADEEKQRFAHHLVRLILLVLDSSVFMSFITNFSVEPTDIFKGYFVLSLCCVSELDDADTGRWASVAQLRRSTSYF